MILPAALVFLMVLATVGTTATVLTTTDMQITGSYRSSAQLAAMAEAGIEEARGRLRAGVTGEITDGHPDKGCWSTYIGAAGKAGIMGYHEDKHENIVSSLQNDLDYIVRVKHETDGADAIQYYGDSDGDRNSERNTVSGENIYRIISRGYDGDASMTVEAEATRIPAINPPGAVYLEAQSDIGGDVNIYGLDSCGTEDKPGISTSGSSGLIDLWYSPVITGAGGTTPNIAYNGDDLLVNGVVEEYSDLADFTYRFSGTHYPYTLPGPADGWGTPTPGATVGDPSSCGESTIVYYDTGGSYVALRAGVTGCGFLLVKGDLIVRGDFSWYGVIVVAGSVTFRDTGSRHITGALIARDSVDGNYYGGSSNIVYCSTAITDQTAYRPLKILSWRETN